MQRPVDAGRVQAGGPRGIKTAALIDVHESRLRCCIFDAHHTWASYKVERGTGSVWMVGGNVSSSTLAAARGQTVDNASELFAAALDLPPGPLRIEC